MPQLLLYLYLYVLRKRLLLKKHNCMLHACVCVRVLIIVYLQIILMDKNEILVAQMQRGFFVCIVFLWGTSVAFVPFDP